MKTRFLILALLLSYSLNLDTCSIMGYIDCNLCKSYILEGLSKLEYRGYDSAGMAIVNGETRIFKCKGRVQELEENVTASDFNGTTAIGHTRWATHGEPNELNAHPQVSYKGNFILVHNGIIENYSRLRRHLEERGVKFSSQTDTEVIVNLIEHLYLEGSLSAEQAITTALNKLVNGNKFIWINRNRFCRFGFNCLAHADRVGFLPGRRLLSPFWGLHTSDSD